MHQAPKTTGQTQIVNALGALLVLEDLFGEADAMDAKPNPELAAGAVGMDVEDDAADGGMIVDDDGTPNNIGTLCVFLPNPRLEKQ